MDFHAMHRQAQPLLIANVWDAASARSAAAAGCQAVGTSSAALAATLGYDDGENLPFDALLGMVRRILAVTDLPVSVDIEAGYAESPSGIAANVRELAALGVVGINLEDSRVIDGGRRMEPADFHAERLREIRSALRVAGVRMFINARTDAFLLGRSDARDETLRRARRYCEAGADGLFVPCVVAEADIAAIVAAAPLPLNVMAMPELPSFDVLRDLGVRRISMGNALHVRMQEGLRRQIARVIAERSFASVFD